MQAGSKFKYLRCITGRHDIPFYYDEEVKVQMSFLDAFLKDDDRDGWSVPGKLPPVDICLRQGDPGFNDPAAERTAFPRRKELTWPLERTQYTKFFLDKDGGMKPTEAVAAATLQYDAKV